MKNKIPLMLFGGVFLLAFDQLLKWQTRYVWHEPDMFGRFFGWRPFFNDGVAFSLPVPGWLTILITVPIVCIVVYLLGLEFFSPSFTGHNKRMGALVLILAGATSNLFDRIVFHTTIDYLCFFTGVINVADILIVCGFVLYFLALRKQN